MHDAAQKNQLSPTKKCLISLALSGYLALMLIGPLSNPVASEHLIQPLEKGVRPLQRALFLGHGYRFFAPDPGPSHLVEFEIIQADGSLVTGQFPDRNDTENAFPRLQYHRWFMLSETIWAEHSMTPAEADFEAQQRQLEALATENTIAGEREIASRIRAQKLEQKRSYQLARKRIDDLVRAVAKNLLQIHDGTQIRLSVRERTIPFPIEVEQGAKLSDPRYLKPEQPPVIGEFTAQELGLSEQAQ